MMQGQRWPPQALRGVVVASAGPTGRAGPKNLPELSPVQPKWPAFIPQSQPVLGSELLLERVNLGQAALCSRDRP